MPAPFRRVGVLGTGLVGGSFALAIKRSYPETRIAGWDHAEVLARARSRGAIDESAATLGEACTTADLIYVALPVEETIRRLPAIAATAPPECLVTDAASTKILVCRAAHATFCAPNQFLAGHPIAGREQGGIQNADGNLFNGATYALIGSEKEAGERGARFVALLEAIGARPQWLSAEEHDHLMAFLSHLPQLAAVALAETVLDGAGEAAAPLAGRGLRDSLRLAGSPYTVWEDICRSSPDLEQALGRLVDRLQELRRRLKSGGLASDFERAERLYKILHGIE